MVKNALLQLSSGGQKNASWKAKAIAILSQRKQFTKCNRTLTFYNGLKNSWFLIKSGNIKDNFRINNLSMTDAINLII